MRAGGFYLRPEGRSGPARERERCWCGIRVTGCTPGQGYTGVRVPRPARNNHHQYPIGGDMDYIHWMDLLIGLGAAGAFVLILAMTDRIGGRK